jgi:hypothetical protein
MKLIALIVGTIAVIWTLAAPAAQGRDDEMRDFARRISEYVELHRQVERYVSPHWLFIDPEEGCRAVTELADAIRRMRPDAREGDIFSPAVSRAFQRQIRHALVVHGVSVAALFDEMRADGGETTPAPTVNEAFSWALGNVMPVFMLQVLPALPDELQYRFVGWDLVLIDLPANLVVDVLRDALAEETDVARR